MHQQVQTFLNSFIIIIIIMIASALIVLHLNNEADTAVRETLSKQLEKINTTQALLATASKRLQLVQSLVLKADNPGGDSDKQQLKELEQSYLRTSEKLLPLLNAREGEILLASDRLNRRISELINQITVLLEHGGEKEAKRIMLEEKLPNTELLLQNLGSLIELERSNAEDLLLLSHETAEANRGRFRLYAVFVILASLSVGGYAVYSGNKLTRDLEDINAYLEEKVSERTESLLDTQKELEENNTNLARLASTDQLTGLFNRNHMNEVLQREHSRYQRYGQKFGIILIDVDHFKRVNDMHGHDVGDTVLAQVAQKLKAAVRSTDFVGRWGGEEFLICCATTDISDIEAIAENIRVTIAETEFDSIGSLTISLGCAIVHPKEDIESVIKRSDVALYEAKNGGRNQTRISAADL